MPEIFTVHGGESGIPAGLQLNGPMRGLYLPDGRLYLPDLPPDVLVRYYPDIVQDISPTEDPPIFVPEPIVVTDLVDPEPPPNNTITPEQTPSSSDGVSHIPTSDPDPESFDIPANEMAVDIKEH